MRTITIDGITKPILDEISIRYNVESIEVTENNEIYVEIFDKQVLSAKPHCVCNAKKILEQTQYNIGISVMYCVDVLQKRLLDLGINLDGRCYVYIARVIQEFLRQLKKEKMQGIG